jgi:hypothetical protein
MALFIGVMGMLQALAGGALFFLAATDQSTTAAVLLGAGMVQYALAVIIDRLPPRA